MPYSVQKSYIGQQISTKEVGGNGRVDITHLYKHPEGKYMTSRICASTEASMYMHCGVKTAMPRRGRGGCQSLGWDGSAVNHQPPPITSLHHDRHD